MGMGDQKLLMAVGAWTSYMDVYWLVLLSAALGVAGVCCMPKRIGVLCRHLYFIAVGWKGHRKLWLPNTKQSALTLPFAVLIFVAYLIRQLEGIPL
jgi:prepilin peptidase CpaA